MKNRQTWIAFVSCVALIVLWFSINSSYKVYQWATQTRTAKPLAVEWQVERQANDRYAITAHYTFLHKGEEFTGATLLQSKRYKNLQTANHFMEECSKNKCIVWYSAFQPNNSTIDRFFPLKSCIYTAIVWSILLYFIWLGYYVGKKYR